MQSSFVAFFVSLLFFMQSLQAHALQTHDQPTGDHKLSGVWQTDGYGYIIDIQGAEVSMYEATSVSCLKAALAVGSMHFNQQKKQWYYPVEISGFIQADMRIIEGKDENILHFHRSDTTSFMKARKLTALPEKCQLIPSSSPTYTAAVFKQTFLENYPFFDEVSRHKSSLMNIDKAGQKEDLFKTLRSSLMVLKDPHTALVNTENGDMFFGHESDQNQIGDDQIQGLKNLVGRKYLTQPTKEYAGGQIKFGKIDDRIGYLSIAQFTEYGEGQNPETIFQKLVGDMNAQNGLSHLIIDLRYNIGGSDHDALTLAGYFTSKSYTAYRKQAVKRGGEKVEWTDGMKATVYPSGTKGFYGPIYILTSGHTLSAAETFIMALMERKPGVIRIGEKTRGSFSDMLPRVLPNGWLFGLPNERFIDKTGKSYDFIGLKPDHQMPAFPPLNAQRDQALDFTLNLIRK